ncbi:hypothetical protein B0H17DRAFT_1212001 [Mycena rosella]|uniref:Extracellular membrane protein CFEM domain-containing protein n=1 Tax=Mycena rosella TaxID=1033263 RepID=A0AAD7G5P8_MYCRO|nr:hypothetical protein B0H17DRAFT_1212001 [Mycena rosella]
MLATIFPIAAAVGLASLNTAAAQGGPGSSIPGITQDQQSCLAHCVSIGIAAAPSNCTSNALPVDVICLCGSSAYTSNVTQCAGATCSVCTTGGCNITADPLADSCNATTVPGSGAAPNSSVSGTAPSPSTTLNAASAVFHCIGRATVITAGLVIVGLLV